MEDIEGGSPINRLKKKMYVLMTFLVFAWGIEYILAKQALEIIEPLTLLFLKYIIGISLILAFKLKLEGKTFIRKKDIPIFVACALFGDLGYFYSEYTAMDYLPVSIITIILAFVPILSVLIDRAVYKRKSSKKMILGICLSVIGIILIIGVDYPMMAQGRSTGYLLAFGAVIMWNIYNFITASLHEEYESITLTLNQLICAILLVLPYALNNLPKWSDFTPAIIFGVLYLGIISTAVCFIIMVKSLYILGPTATAMFSNFMPVTTTIFGWMFLKETILPLQIAGGILVIISGCYVIKEKANI